MKDKLIIKVMAIVAVVAVNMVSAYASLTLTISDSNGTQSYTDTQQATPGSVTVPSGFIGGWSFTSGSTATTATFATDDSGAPYIDLSYSATAGSPGLPALTITLTETGVSVPYANGLLDASIAGAIGNSSHESQLYQYEQINGGQVGSQGPFTSGTVASPFNNDASVPVGGLSDPFSLTEQIVITPIGTGLNTEGHSFGDASLTVDPVVPEPSTILGGALLLLPFGASTLRILRKRQAA